MEESNEILGHVLMELANKFKFNLTKESNRWVLSNGNYKFISFIYDGAIIVELESKNLKIENVIIGVYYNFTNLRKGLENDIKRN